MPSLRSLSLLLCSLLGGFLLHHQPDKGTDDAQSEHEDNGGQPYRPDSGRKEGMYGRVGWEERLKMEGMSLVWQYPSSHTDE